MFIDRDLRHDSQGYQALSADHAEANALRRVSKVAGYLALMLGYAVIAYLIFG